MRWLIRLGKLLALLVIAVLVSVTGFALGYYIMAPNDINEGIHNNPQLLH